MANYEYSRNDNIVDVAIEGKDGQYRVQVGDREISLDAWKLSDHLLNISVNGKQQRVYVAASGGKTYVHIDGKIFSFDDVDSAANSRSVAHGASGAAGAIMSPMPGNLIKLMVAVGDTVVEGQPLVIVEAMKMENEIRSPANGIVKKVKYSVGDLVDAGVPIVELETEDE
jgi:3-methylcrotonyl-CoA carboxylase alpha subunit